MTHKDYMNWLKENDPILYYELTSNPTGTDSDEFGCINFVIMLLTVVLICFYSFSPQNKFKNNQNDNTRGIIRTNICVWSVAINYTYKYI